MTDEFKILLALLEYAAKNYPSKVLVTPFPGLIRKLKQAKKTHRINGHGDAIRVPGVAVIELPNEAIGNLKDESGMDAWFLVRVRRSVTERFRSPIALPGEERVS